VIEPVPAAMSSATSPGRGATAWTMCPRQRPSWPMLRIRAQRSYPGARGANKARATRGGVAVTCETVPIVAANGHTTQVLLLTSLLRPAATRQAGIIAQGFALAGTFVGVTLLLTVGPRTTLDIVIHLGHG